MWKGLTSKDQCRVRNQTFLWPCIPLSSCVLQTVMTEDQIPTEMLSFRVPAQVERLASSMRLFGVGHGLRRGKYWKLASSSSLGSGSRSGPSSLGRGNRPSSASILSQAPWHRHLVPGPFSLLLPHDHDQDSTPRRKASSLSECTVNSTPKEQQDPPTSKAGCGRQGSRTQWAGHLPRAWISPSC